MRKKINVEFIPFFGLGIGFVGDTLVITLPFIAIAIG
jgi:hypothetical protein